MLTGEWKNQSFRIFMEVLTKATDFNSSQYLISSIHTSLAHAPWPIFHLTFVTWPVLPTKPIRMLPASSPLFVIPVAFLHTASTPLSLLLVRCDIHHYFAPKVDDATEWNEKLSGYGNSEHPLRTWNQPHIFCVRSWCLAGKVPHACHCSGEFL